MSHFQTRVKNFFAIRENFFSRRPFGRGQLVGANGLCAFSTPPSSIFPQKILRICSLLTDYSINMPKRHRKMFDFSCKPSVFLARKVSPLGAEGITDLPVFNNLCFLPFSLLFPVTQTYQGIWHCLIPLPGRSRPSRFHSCSSAAPETAGDTCPPLRPS